MNLHVTMWYVILPSILFSIFAFGLYYFVYLPTDNQFEQYIADDKAKTSSENYTLHSMNCKQLGDWLVTDKWYDRDNLIWAQNHYLVNCK